MEHEYLVPEHCQSLHRHSDRRARPQALAASLLQGKGKQNVVVHYPLSQLTRIMRNLSKMGQRTISEAEAESITKGADGDEGNKTMEGEVASRVVYVSWYSEWKGEGRKKMGKKQFVGRFNRDALNSHLLMCYAVICIHTLLLRLHVSSTSCPQNPKSEPGGKRERNMHISSNIHINLLLN